jgi:hypothetical protein
MPDFFENFKDGKAIVRRVNKEFMELKDSDDTIEVTEDDFDEVLQYGVLYHLNRYENTVNEGLKDIIAEDHNNDMRKAITDFNKQADEYNIQHATDADFESVDHKTFTAVDASDMIFELDSSYIALTEDGALNYIPFNYIFHQKNKKQHDSIGIMLYEYVVEDGFNLEDAIEIVLL